MKIEQVRPVELQEAYCVSAQERGRIVGKVWKGCVFVKTWLFHTYWAYAWAAERWILSQEWFVVSLGIAILFCSWKHLNSFVSVTAVDSSWREGLMNRFFTLLSPITNTFTFPSITLFQSKVHWGDVVCVLWNFLPAPISQLSVLYSTAYSRLYWSNNSTHNTETGRLLLLKAEIFNIHLHLWQSERERVEDLNFFLSLPHLSCSATHTHRHARTPVCC